MYEDSSVYEDVGRQPAEPLGELHLANALLEVRLGLADDSVVQLLEPALAMGHHLGLLLAGVLVQLLLDEVEARNIAPLR